MNFNKSENNPTTSPPPKHPQSQSQPQFNLQQTLTTFHHNVSSLITQLTQNPSSLRTHFQSTLSRLQCHANQALNPSPGACKSPAWARITPGDYRPAPRPGLSTQAIEERLAGVPVYALSNGEDEFVLVSGAWNNKALGLFCFKKEDAEAIRDQIGNVDPDVQSSSKIVAVALNKIFQLKAKGVAFRLIPEASEVKHAIKEQENAGIPDDGFWGVPVFQAKSLILRSENMSYRPAFFKKEDLEKSLLRASREQGKLNPGFRKGEIEVAVLEEIIKDMQKSSSPWNDVVFIPPGFDISTDPSLLKK